MAPFIVLQTHQPCGKRHENKRDHFDLASFGRTEPQIPSPTGLDINEIYKHTALHFQNFPNKLGLLAMLSSFTGRITTPTPVISVIGAVVVISVGVVVKVPV
jgi:hypothetical protein